MGYARRLSVAELAACLALAACSARTPAERSYRAISGVEAARFHNALVRFVNRLPGQPAMDLMFGGTVVFSGVAPQATVTPFQQVPGEQRDFLLVPSGQHEALVTFNATLSAGMHYTLVAHSLPDGTAGLTLIRDILQTPAEGKARVRVINVASNLGAVRLCLGDNQQTVVGDTAFEAASGWREVDPAVSPGELMAGGKVVAPLPRVLWVENHDYTYIVFAGQTPGSVGISSFVDQVE